MKSEEIYLVFSGWVLSIISFSVFGNGLSGILTGAIFAFFSVYFVLKYSGLINRKKKKKCSS